MSNAANDNDMRALVRQVFLAAIAETSVEKSFEKHVEVNRRFLVVFEVLYDLNSFSRIFVVAMGKAAYPLAQALKGQLGIMASGILVAPQTANADPQPMLEGFRHFAGGHPLPNTESDPAPNAIFNSPRSPSGPSLLLYRISRCPTILVQKPVREEFVKYVEGSFHSSRWWPILSSEVLQKAAAAQAALAGFAVEIDNTCDDWEYDRAADYLLDRLRKLRQGATRVCLISGGEVTVRVPENAGGVGGRNQQFALYCATN